MAEEIDFENRHFWNFKSHVTLTLTSDDLESHIIVNDSSTLTNTTIWFVAALCLIVDVRTYVRRYGRTDIFTGFIRSSLRRCPKMQDIIVSDGTLNAISAIVRTHTVKFVFMFDRDITLANRLQLLTAYNPKYWAIMLLLPLSVSSTHYPHIRHPTFRLSRINCPEKNKFGPRLALSDYFRVALPTTHSTCCPGTAVGSACDCLCVSTMDFGKKQAWPLT